MKIKKWLLIAVFIGLILLNFGCTRNFVFEVPSSAQANPSNKIPSAAALYLSSDFCAYSYKTTANGETWIFNLGPTLCEYSKNIIQQAFTRTSVVMDKNNIDNDIIDLIITPKVVDTSVYFRPGIPAKAISLVVVEWVFLDKNGEVVYMTTNEGNGLDDRTFAKHTKKLQASVQSALDDLFNNSYNEFIASQELRQIAKLSK